ncbi:MAG: hypothetical protein LBS11_03360 [Oscillospiraceae bacterium]|nr:hypothetical protein [Oscillospiraceae bacterium]
MASDTARPSMMKKLLSLCLFDNDKRASACELTDSSTARLSKWKSRKPVTSPFITY